MIVLLLVQREVWSFKSDPGWSINCASGQYSSAKVHRSLVVRKKAGVEIGSDIDDYEITVNELEGLTPEIIDGL